MKFSIFSGVSVLVGLLSGLVFVGVFGVGVVVIKFVCVELLLNYFLFKVLGIVVKDIDGLEVGMNYGRVVDKYVYLVLVVN